MGEVADVKGAPGLLQTLRQLGGVDALGCCLAGLFEQSARAFGVGEGLLIASVDRRPLLLQGVSGEVEGGGVFRARREAEFPGSHEGGVRRRWDPGSIAPDALRRNCAASNFAEP